MEKITLHEVKNGRLIPSRSIESDDLEIGVQALYECQRNRMGSLTVGQISKLEKVIKETKQMTFTRNELLEILGGK